MKKHTIVTLYKAMREDLKKCHTDTERTCCSAICIREIFDLARAKNNQFTAQEKTILSKLFYFA